MFWVTKERYLQDRHNTAGKMEVDLLRTEVHRLTRELELLKAHIGVTVRMRPSELVIEPTEPMDRDGLLEKYGRARS